MALEKIINRSDIVQINIEKIKKWIPSTIEEFMSDELTQAAIERCLQVSIEALMDVCIQLVKFLKLGTPDSPDGVLSLLEPHLKSITIIRKLKGLRNILVHQYGKIDPELIFNHANQFCIDGELIINEIIGLIRG